jgi:alkylation response protein AidB-like acyl-CoA dehydrogenase
MRFEPDTDESQLQDSLRRLLDDRAPFTRRRDAVRGAPGWDCALWPALAELGIAALALPETHGGFALRPIAWLPVLRELGRALALQPFLPAVVLAGTAIVRAGSEAQRQALLPGIANGTRVIAFAHDEVAARHAPLWIETRARRDGDGWLLDGAKCNVLFGGDAGQIVVSSRTAGEPGDEDGVMLFLVDTAQAAIRREPTRLIDDTPAADIELRSACATALGTAAGALPALRAALDAGLAASCAETLGLAERAHELTVEYVGTRQQFGRPIGANQAVRHRVAEMRVALETLRSAAMLALLALEQDDAQERARELARARMLASRHGGFICEQAIQLHGGIGMTVEYPVGHCLRRHTVLDLLAGDAATHAARLGASLAALDDSAAAIAA